MKFYNLQKGVENVLAMLKGDTKGFEVVSTLELEVLAILMVGCKTFPAFKRGTGKLLCCLEGVP